MTTTDLDVLESAIASGQVVVIAGSGVAAAATKGAPTATWLGLVRNGIEFVAERDPSSAAWARMVESQLSLAQSGEPDQLMQAASQVGSRLRKLGPQAFATWIDSAVGRLAPLDEGWIRAIHALGAPIFTTNYDTLIEQVLEANGCDWLEPSGFQRVLARAGGVGHLHGRVGVADSIVLSEADYARLRQSPGAQAIQQGLSVTRSILYIGCGDTLTDPNFDSLLAWHRELFPESGMVHFRLCREADLSQLREAHRNDNIRMISYGESYDDLPAFLDALAPGSAIARSDAGVVRDFVGEAREVLLDELRTESIIGENRLDLERAQLQDLVVPPVLLPVPHPEFFRVRGKDEAKPTRLDLSDELVTDGVLLVVAEENAGLSTTLRYLLHEASLLRARTAPLLLDFRRFPSGVGPLASQLTLAAVQRGLIDSRRSPLPPVTIAIDNVHGHSKTAARLVDDLLKQDGLTVLGVNSAYEAEVTDLLRSAGVDFRTGYLARFGSAEVLVMARLASPASAEMIADGVIATLQSQHLPRTPFTVALLVAIFLRGESLIANASPTTVLDQYVSHLLGRDESNQDSRFRLTATDRESIVTDLASRLVLADQGSTLQSEAISGMEEFFARFGWSESPTDVLQDLAKRRILTFDGSQVRFTQSSFLHLFAAKAVVKQTLTLDKVLERPLYYSQLIRAYAALVRHDASLLRSLLGLLGGRSPNAESPIYAESEPGPAPADLEVRILESAAVPPPSSSHQDPPEFPDPLESDDKDVLPFPQTTDEDLTELARYTQSVDLLSAVLRDSEEVADLDLKTEALRRVLEGWGHTAEALVDDEAFGELVASIRKAFEPSPDKGITQEEAEDFARMLPFIIIMVGIHASLASRKLLMILNRLIAEEKLQTDSRLAVPAALLAYAIEEPGWEQQWARLLENFERQWVVREVMARFLFVAYVEADSGSDTDRRLGEMLVSQYLSGYKFANVRERNSVANAYRAHIEKIKLSNHARLDALDRRRSTTGAPDDLSG